MMSTMSAESSGIPTPLLNYLKEMSQEQLDINDLSDRKRKELIHHNIQRDTKVTESVPKDTFEKLHGNKKYYSTVQLIREYGERWVEEKVADKIFVDYACGNGERSIHAALSGAKLVIGIDLSDISLENARQAAAEAGVGDRCHFIQTDCENTGLPANSVDIVYCSGVLHHLDLSYAFPEIRRILKPGGCALALEALDYNPLIKLYRNMTPSMRTEWEKNHILSLKDVRFASRFFEVRNVKFWHLFSILAVVFRNNEEVKTAALRILNALDKIVLRIPGVRLMAWMFTFEVHKRAEE